MAKPKPKRLPRLVWPGLPGLILILAGVDALALWGGTLPVWLARSLWGVAAVAATVLLRVVLGPLFGPVLFYDLLRATRRGRYALLRCLYGAALLVMLFAFYSRWCDSIWDVFALEHINRHDAPRFAEEFFHAFISVQYVTVALLTPALTAGALAEEKERRTLEFLFTTELRNREIVLGKLASRLALLALLVLVGLPVLGLLQFLGGVDPNLVLAGFAATGVTVLSLAGLSIFNSAYSRKPVTAIFLTYLEAGAYLVISYIAVWAATGQRPDDPPPSMGAVPPTGIVLDCFTAGNIWLAILKLFPPVPAWMVGMPPAPTTPMAALPKVLAGYCTFHGLVAVVAVLAAILPLRVWNRWQASGRSRRAFVLGLAQTRLPRVSDRPMVWKEVFAEPIFRFNRAGLVVVGTFVAMCLILGVFFVILAFAAGFLLGDLDRAMNMVARYLGTFVACLLLAGVAVRAAGCISGERERRTLDSLLSSPLTNQEILWAKWLGSVTCGRRVWWYLAAVWLVAALTSGLHPLALPLLVAAWAVYAMFLASLGVWLSLVSRNSLRATVWTVVTMLACCIGPWLLGFVSRIVLALFYPIHGPSGLYSTPGRMPPSVQPTAEPAVWLGDVLPLLAPPSTLNFLAFYGRDFDPTLLLVLDNSNSMAGAPSSYPIAGGGGVTGLWVRILAVVLTLVLYGLAAAVLWGLARARFARMTGRVSGGQRRPVVGKAMPGGWG
jgi:ABC-type transport system involved in multi-copper enzyme maturation permease subunit